MDAAAVNPLAVRALQAVRDYLLLVEAGMFTAVALSGRRLVSWARAPRPGGAITIVLELAVEARGQVPRPAATLYVSLTDRDVVERPAGVADDVADVLALADVLHDTPDGGKLKGWLEAQHAVASGNVRECRRILRVMGRSVRGAA